MAEENGSEKEKKPEQPSGLTPEEPQLKVPEKIPLLPVRDVVVFPFMIIPLFVAREGSIAAINKALGEDRMILLASQKEMGEEYPTKETIYETGTVCIIMRMLKLPDNQVRILVQGISRAKILEYTQTQPMFEVHIKPLDEMQNIKKTSEVEALMRNVRQNIDKAIQLGKSLPPELTMVLESLDDPGRFSDLVAANIGINVENAQSLLETMDPTERLRKVNDLLNKELDVLSVQAKIKNQAKEEMTKTQREYYLREQLRAIQQELGEVDEKTAEIQELREKIEKAEMPEEAKEEALKQLKKLEMMHAESMEASTLRNYLDWLVELPWSVSTIDSIDLRKAKKILDEDHFDLDKVKERILEYLSVRKLNPEMKGPILCFVGPPGVGKTSVGKSIARAMDRKFMRMSLGGIRDEAEIRGHRRTYVGALPGRIIQGIKQVGSNNPVFMLDEIDKLGVDFRGDPSSALLEVLDPEQNFSFRDHYINMPFDLSHVMFITTANLADPIPPPLRDRMELIDLPGYTLEEKVAIAIQYLVPRQMNETGIKKSHIEFSDEALKGIISQYTREAGVRNLERNIGNICRKVARKVAEGEKKKQKISLENLHTFLGPSRFLAEEEMEKDEVGVATGLAWTETGGEILRVEVSITPGNKNLILTGHLGEVMKESAQAALSYARHFTKDYDLPDDYFEKKEVHIHVPAGAIPKDGPSAGVTMGAALFSAMSRIPVRKDVAMTGEITLRGRVLPIGGLKEKALAALRADIHNLILPERNRKDLEDIPPDLRKKINFNFASNMNEVLKYALVNSRHAPEVSLNKRSVKKNSRAAKNYKIGKSSSKKEAVSDKRKKMAAKRRG